MRRVSGDHRPSATECAREAILRVMRRMSRMQLTKLMENADEIPSPKHRRVFLEAIRREMERKP
jgi:hypothetical protein